MKNKVPSLFSLAKYANLEIMMESQYMSAGAHQAKLLEKFEKNKNYIRNQAIAMKLISAFLMLFMPLLSFIFYFDIRQSLSEHAVSIEGEMIIYSMFITIFYIVLVLYMILFGLFTISSLMTGNAFKWLQTLPLSEEKVRKLGFITLFRSQGIMIILMIISFPIALLIMTHSFFTFFMSLISSFLITIFSVSILIVVGEKYSHLFSEEGTRSKKKNLFRIISLLSYFIIAFGTGLVLNVLYGVTDNLIQTFSVSPPQEFFVIVLSLIPFPFSPGFLVALSLIHGEIPAMIWIFTAIGVIIFAIITYLTYRLAIKSLKIITFSEIENEPKEKPYEQQKIEVKFEVISPVRAYIKKDLVASTKDYQSLIFILMPIVYPLILLFSFNSPITSEINSPFGIIVVWAIVIAFLMFIPPILVGGLLSIDESGSTVLASLPIVPRDQFKAKMILMLSIHSISLILIAITLTLQTQSIVTLYLMLSSLPIAWCFLLIIFTLKIYLFGKLKYKYVLEEVNKQHKILKWIGLIGAEIAFYLIVVIFNSMIFIFFGIFSAILASLLMGLFSLALLLFALSIMFPKVEKMPGFKAGGYLRNHPIIGGLVIVILFNVFLNIGGLFENLFLPLLFSVPYIGKLLVEFILIEASLIFLLLFIIPIGMKLPSKTNSFSEYIKEIGISKFKPLGKNILLGVGIFIIYASIAFFGGTLFGEFIFIPELLFGNPNPTLPGLLSFGWFIWIIMLRPGIWEEVTFRGVNIPLLSNKKSQLTTIVLSGILFGLAHSFNVIDTLIAGGDPINTVYQVIYASFIGFSTGYVFIKTKSLIPCIIFHYLFDTVGTLIINFNIINPLAAGMYLFFFIGVIPSFLNIYFVKLVSPLWNKEKSS